MRDMPSTFAVSPYDARHVIPFTTGSSDVVHLQRLEVVNVSAVVQASKGCVEIAVPRHVTFGNRKLYRGDTSTEPVSVVYCTAQLTDCLLAFLLMRCQFYETSRISLA